jgi:N-acetylmuramoyl-L-alanine amidase
VVAVVAAAALAGSLWSRGGRTTDSPSAAPLTGVVVAIDPGHGGVDPGASSPDRQTQEEHLTLALALQLRAELERAGAVVVLTRETDADPSGLPWGHPDRYRNNLRARIEAGVRTGARAFVSLHMDSSRSRNDPRRGPDTFYGPRDAQQGEGVRLAAAIQHRFHEAFGVTDKVYPLNVYVLRENPVPAALIECAFLNNPQDLARIRDPSYQRALVQAIALGITDFVRGAPASRP